MSFHVQLLNSKYVLFTLTSNAILRLFLTICSVYFILLIVRQMQVHIFFCFDVTRLFDGCEVDLGNGVHDETDIYVTYALERDRYMFYISQISVRARQPYGLCLCLSETAKANSDVISRQFYIVCIHAPHSDS